MTNGVSFSPVDGLIPPAGARHAATMAHLHDTVRVHIATGDIDRGIRVKRKAALPFRSFERDDYGNLRRTRDGREAIERLWQRHFGILEHFDDADRLPTRQWMVVGRDEAVDLAGGRHSKPKYRLVGISGNTTLDHDCANHLSVLAVGNVGPNTGPQSFHVERVA